MSQDHETHLSKSYESKRTIGKVTASSATYGGITGLATLSIIWFFNFYLGVELPEYVAIFIVLVVVYIANLFGGWLVKPGPGTRRG